MQIKSSRKIRLLINKTKCYQIEKTNTESPGVVDVQKQAFMFRLIRNI